MNAWAEGLGAREGPAPLSLDELVSLGRHCRAPTCTSNDTDQSSTCGGSIGAVTDNMLLLSKLRVRVAEGTVLDGVEGSRLVTKQAAVAAVHAAGPSVSMSGTSTEPVVTEASEEEFEALVRGVGEAF